MAKFAQTIHIINLGHIHTLDIVEKYGSHNVVQFIQNDNKIVNIKFIHTRG